MGTISSRSPAMAYSNGGLWVSTFDEIGRRCWVNNVTGERTYRFIGGTPVPPMADPMVSPCPVPPSPTSWGYSVQSPTPVPQNPNYAPGYGGGSAMVPFAGTGAPPVTPGGDGGIAHRMRKYYLRSSLQDRSWMWR